MGRSKDLDESRRLLYMAMAASRTDRYELVGTITNALAHHGLGMDPHEVMDLAIATVSGDETTGWAEAQIARLTEAIQEKCPGRGSRREAARPAASPPPSF
jgi:hypothetical protein